MRRQYFYLILATLFVGCAQDRPVRFVQSDDANLTAITALDGHRYQVKTLAEIRGIKTSAATKVDLENYSKVNALSFVNFESDATLLQKDILFRALPNTEGIYSVCYEVNNTHVVVHKVAKPEYLPFQELTYKRTDVSCLNEGEVAIPLSGYPTNLYGTYRLLDPNEERTHLMRKVSVQTRDQAEYIEYNPASRVDFDAITKVDIFPSDFLVGSDDNEEDNQWFYNSVIVNSSREANLYGAIQGRELSVGFKDVSRIKFKKKNNAIVGIDANIAEEIEGSSEDSTEAGEERGDSNEVPSINLPAQWIGFTVQTVDGQPVLQEELVDDTHKEANSNYKDRDFVKINFTLINKNQFESEYLYFPNPTLDKVEVADGYMAVTITYNNYPFVDFRGRLTKEDGITVKYSFRKAHPAKSKKQRFVKTKDHKRFFGTFFSKRDYVKGSLIRSRIVDRERFNLMNRFIFDDDERIIEFHFSRSTPEIYRDIGKKAIEVWNQAFQDANTDITVQINETNKDLGDLRYNIINFLDHDEETINIGGYGPSVADTRSGEIISANSNIYVPVYRRGLERIVRSYIYHRLGAYNKRNPFGELCTEECLTERPPVFAPDRLEQGMNAMERTNTLAAMNLAYDYELENFIKIQEVEAQLTEEMDPLSRFLTEKKRKHFLHLLSGSRDLSKGEFYLYKKRDELKERYKDQLAIHKARREKLKKEIKGDISSNFMIKANYVSMNRKHIRNIEANCKDIVDPFIDRMKDQIDFTVEISKRGGKEIDTLEEFEVLKNCANRLLPQELLSTVMHELGHNFGMRHNFAGSSDPENFIPQDENDGVETSSSSIMDYVSSIYDRLQKPGRYDVAFLRYVYANSVEFVKEDGTSKIVPLDLLDHVNPAKMRSISEFAKDYEEANKGLKLRKYRFCTDHESVGIFLNKDPMCGTHDLGSTPFKKVQESQKSIENIFYMYSERFDLDSYHPMGFQQAIINNIDTMANVYYYWRYTLGQFLKEDRYLDTFKNQEELDAKITEMKNSENETHRKNYNLYYEAAVEAYKNIKKLTYLNPRFCVVKKIDNSVETVEFIPFYQLREDVYNEFDDANEDATIFDCDYGLALDYLDQEGYQLVGITGSIFNNLERTLNIHSDEGQHYEIAGVSPIKSYALAVLTARVYPTPQTGLSKYVPYALMGFYPAFVDEPKIREDLIESLMDRLLNGIPIAQLGHPEHPDKYLISYELEEEALSYILMGYGYSIMLPESVDNTAENESRSRKFIAKRWSSSTPVNLWPTSHSTRIDAVRTLMDGGQSIYSALPENKIAYAIMKRRELLLQEDRLVESYKAGVFDRDLVKKIIEEEIGDVLLLGDSGAGYSEIQARVSEIVRKFHVLEINDYLKGTIEQILEKEILISQSEFVISQNGLEKARLGILLRQLSNMTGKDLSIKENSLDQRIDSYFDGLSTMLTKAWGVDNIEQVIAHYEKVGKKEKKAQLSMFNTLMGGLWYRDR